MPHTFRIGVPEVRIRRLNTDDEFLPLFPTTGGIVVRYRHEPVLVSPNDSPDFAISGSRRTEIEFSIIASDLREFIRAGGGHYVRYSGADTFETMEYSLTAAIPQFVEVMLVMPPDTFGEQDIRFYSCMRLVLEQNTFAETWSRQEIGTIKIKLEDISETRFLEGSGSRVREKVRMHPPKTVFPTPEDDFWYESGFDETVNYAHL